jgi:hypothetical protein
MALTIRVVAGRFEQIIERAQFPGIDPFHFHDALPV